MFRRVRHAGHHERAMRRHVDPPGAQFELLHNSVDKPGISRVHSLWTEWAQLTDRNIRTECSPELPPTFHARLTRLFVLQSFDSKQKKRVIHRKGEYLLTSTMCIHTKALTPLKTPSSTAAGVFPTHRSAMAQCPSTFSHEPCAKAPNVPLERSSNRHSARPRRDARGISSP